jgi:hypothetical protein
VLASYITAGIVTERMAGRGGRSKSYIHLMGDASMGRMFRKQLFNKLRYLAMALMISVTALAGTSSAYASSTEMGYISFIIMLPGGVVVFNLSGGRTSVPSCAASYPQRWAFNVNSAAGQALAALLSAFGMGKPIQITGSSACGDWGDTESLSAFVIG